MVFLPPLRASSPQQTLMTEENEETPTVGADDVPLAPVPRVRKPRVKRLCTDCILVYDLLGTSQILNHEAFMT